MKRPILFLDLASTTGWAEGSPGERATCGSIRLAPPGSSPGAIGSGFMNFLVPRLQAFRPSLIVYESPFIQNKMNANTTRVLWGLGFMTETIADRMGIQVREANLNTIRKHMLGFVPRGSGVKEAVVAFVSRLGYEPQDDNAADALLGWLFACAIADPKSSIATAPLFQPRE